MGKAVTAQGSRSGLSGSRLERLEQNGAGDTALFACLALTHAPVRQVYTLVLAAGMGGLLLGYNSSNIAVALPVRSQGLWGAAGGRVLALAPTCAA